ncbi:MULTISPECIES: serine hydrolase domain-containing protein [Flavobacteriaceae]|uniref:serine hydrolase domain-containing protein n=1 Tax=Flavobacteriaceae TaxID=49546 RepID=UPI00234A976C|nr:serine hydrolase domain-containing protein [Muricauda sp. SP22]MDC6363642.1 serine hydrolase [Muricauda sp. SP22]
MHRKYFYLICFLLLGKIASSQASKENKESIIDYLNRISYPEFSGVILLAEKDSLLFERAYGYSSIEYEVENNVNTLFNVASITKTMTAVAALQLVDRGLLDLDMPVGKYLPDYPNKTVRDSVTAFQLLTHTAGLNNFLVDDFKDMGKLNLKAPKDYIPLFASKPLLFTPGSKYSYSAAGYVVLGLLIEKLNGESYHKYMKDKLFKKAGMKNTIAIPIDSIVKNKASGYTSYFGESAHLSKNDSYLGYANPAGFYYSTVNDIYMFFEALKNYRLISEPLTKKMMSPLVKGYYTNYGFGISVDERWEQTIVGHTGGWYGVQCELMYFEKDKITAVIISNVDTAVGEGMNKISNYIKQVLANKTIPKFK